MDKRYQIFISSTFADLENERKAIMEAIIEIGCFPAGMEMFPATDLEQFEYIKSVIDESDYYVLIIAGRYGSVADDGISYTEKEFEYAKEKGIPILAFVKKDIDNIPVSKTDQDVQKKRKLDKFRKKVLEGRVAKFWDNADELKYQIHSSLSKEFLTHPRYGWIRGDICGKDGFLSQLNALQKENTELKKQIDKSSSKNKFNIDILKRNFIVDYQISDENDENILPQLYEIETNLYEIMVWCSEDMMEYITTSSFCKMVNTEIVETEANDGKVDKDKCYITDWSFKDIKLKMQAYGLVEIIKYSEYTPEKIKLSLLGREVLFYTVKNEDFRWYIDKDKERK